MTADIVTEEVSTSPELALLLSLLDEAIGACAHREIVSADEMVNYLLDIRQAALGLAA